MFKIEWSMIPKVIRGMYVLDGIDVLNTVVIGQNMIRVILPKSISKHGSKVNSRQLKIVHKSSQILTWVY